MSAPELRFLYQHVVLDHYRRPRNLRRQGPPARRAEGDNPLCGDHVSIFLTLDGEKVNDVSFDGAGCALCIASASLMTEALSGMTRREADALCTWFRDLVTNPDAPAEGGRLGNLAPFAAVREHPTRVPCVLLAWTACQVALARPADPGLVD